MKTFTDEQLCNSPTLQKLSVLSKINPINTNDSIDVDGALAPPLVYLIDALDNDQIIFNDRADRNALWMMLFVCFQLITQPRPTSPVKH